MGATSPQRLLRIAVMQEGSYAIIDERVLRRPGPVTAGEDARSTFIVPAVDGLPARFTVFEHRAGRYQLVYTSRMQGRVALDAAGPRSLEELRRAGPAQARGEDTWVLELPESARGVVQLGTVSFIFNFVAPLPEAPPPELPPEVKGGAWRTVDRVFFVVLALSLLAHLAGASFIALADVPPERELALDELPDRFARVLVPPKPPQPEKRAEVAVSVEADKEQEKEKKDEEKPRDAPAAADKRAEPRPSAEELAKQRAALAKRVASTGLLKVLGSSGGNAGSGAFADLLGGSTGGQDIASALSGARGGGVVAQGSGAGSGGPRGAGTGAVAGIGEVATQGGGKVDLGEKREVQVSGSVRDAPPEVDGADVDRDALARYVRARLKAIQSCYEKELKRNAGLKGKVVVRFSIQSTGRAGDIDIEENSVGSEAVASCIRTVIRSWVFPFKPEDDVPVVYPFVFAPAS